MGACRGTGGEDRTCMEKCREGDSWKNEMKLVEDFKKSEKRRRRGEGGSIVTESADSTSSRARMAQVAMKVKMLKRYCM